VQRNKQINPVNKPKAIVKEVTNKNLPNLPKSNANESDINEYMKVLRQTNQEIASALLDERTKAKKEEKIAKKSKNFNVVKQNLNSMRNRNEEKDSLKKKIRQMRRDKVFPLPKSFTNYKRRNGFISKNLIKIEN
jgi:hypothetical protein